MKTHKYFKPLLSSDSKTSYLFILVICLTSRLLTSINYLEDIDSMRFAMSLLDYNILEQRPHFPGYPIFCFFAKMIYSLIGSLGLTFSIIGGISTFIIIYYCDLIFRMLINEKSIYLPLLLFLSPLLWNLSNRYMSDLFGLSLVMMVTYYFICFYNSKKIIKLYLSYFLIGLIAGVRISFLPFFIPFFFVTISSFSKQIFFKSLFVLLCGVIIWMVPLVIITGVEDIFVVSINHITGHFFNWGGSILTSKSSYSLRFLKLIESIWADGIGGFWMGRNIITILVSLGWILSFLSSINRIKVLIKEESKVFFLLLLSITSYVLWIFLFQNVIYKSRHIIPLIPFILMISSIGFSSILKFDKSYKYIINTFLLCLFFTTSYLNWQHQMPSAIAQAKSYVINDQASLKLFCSKKLINKYLKNHKGTENITVKDINHLKDIENYYTLGYVVYSTINLDFLNFKLEDKNVFYHNPYVNRLWPTMYVYKYKK